MNITTKWRIHLFAGLAERLGTRLLEVAFPEARLEAGEIKRRLAERYPEQADLIAVSFVARNQAFAADDAFVGREDELALLPPVSGGMPEEAENEAAARREADRYAILEDTLDTAAVLSAVSHPDHGAALLFVGTTREWTGGKRTVTLEYEAYLPMARAALKTIGEEIGERWPGTLCAIHHRIGTVGIGEASVLIAVSAPHRAGGYEASRYAIERLKMTVPIWKKEVYEDGTAWQGHQLGPWDPLATPDAEGGRR
ncbi:molybdenum cofactor biosynthesis protein [Cohnella nanjingensis]|uniref:Molybdopterin synthase catalytic subunit n=1 Tax=Cohnella nanjingensis TaxID=1387779 RepID=A0A7X0RRK2_9BACL|nr:molybdenum cofactor biosynthesis protein MoaE [Cohnella nanjingensis]MBB6672347.1 molybdenum cofactor biosynthesis protein MoaE [Cohnella nanjingensis]